MKLTGLPGRYTVPDVDSESRGSDMQESDLIRAWATSGVPTPSSRPGNALPPAQVSGTPAEPSSYCLECFAPIYSRETELCEKHLWLAIHVCERCGERPAVVRENGYEVCVTGRCLAWARGAA